MAYDSTNLALKTAMIGRASSTSAYTYGGNTWAYKSTADAVATVAGSSYFSDGHKRGMRKYDSVEFLDVGSTVFYIMTVTAVTTGAGATATTVLSTATA